MRDVRKVHSLRSRRTISELLFRPKKNGRVRRRGEDNDDGGGGYFGRVWVGKKGLTANQEFAPSPCTIEHALHGMNAHNIKPASAFQSSFCRKFSVLTKYPRDPTNFGARMVQANSVQWIQDLRTPGR